MKGLWTLKNKKGFTLIEIIVVLVILAILAAFGIPSMIGFVEDSRAKAYISEARTVLVAAQMLITEDEAANSADPEQCQIAQRTGTPPAAIVSGTALVGNLVAFQNGRIQNILSSDVNLFIDPATFAINTGGTTPIIDIYVVNGAVRGLIYNVGEYWILMIPGLPAETIKGTALPTAWPASATDWEAAVPA